MNTISPEIEKQVMALKLQGFSNREIQKKTGVSIGSVSNIAAKIEEKYGQEPDAVIEFYRQLKKADITISDIIKGVATFKKLEQLKINEEELDFLSKLYSKCKDENISPEDLSKYAQSLLDVQSSSDVNLQELPSYCKKLHDQYLELCEKIDNLEEKKSGMQKELSSMSQEKDKISKDMEEYHPIKKKLDSHHIEISEVDKLATMLNQAKANKYNIGEIKNYLQEERGLRSSIKQYKSQLAEFEIKLKSTSKQYSEVSNKLVSTTKEYAHLSLAINAIKELLSKGINPSAILHWNEILDSSGLTPQSLIKDLDAYASLSQIIQSKRENLDAMEQELAKLAPQVKALQLEKNSLEASIGTMEQYIIKTMGQVKEKAENSINELSTRSHQEITSHSKAAKENLAMLSDESQKAMIQCTKTIQNEFKDMSCTAKSEIEYVKSEIMCLVHELQNTSEEFGRMEALLPLLRIITGKSASMPEICITLDFLLTQIQNCKEIQNQPGMKNSLATLQRQVKLHLEIPA